VVEHTRLAQSLPAVQPPPVLHAGHLPPPQSVPVSFPFEIASEHVAGWHTPPEQCLLWQSGFAPHAFASAQGGQLPPQSVSVSSPFFAPSPQPGGAQMWLVAQNAVVQSPLTRQPEPLGQPAQYPPQSMSVSVPFFCPSAQPAAWHKEFLQTLVAQSFPSTHALPFAHGPHDVPPQSTSVSLPFTT